MAAAVWGDRKALGELASRPDRRAAVAIARVAPALALRANELGVAGFEVEGWRAELRNAATAGLVLRHELAGIAAALAGVGVAWAPLKGLGLPASVYPRWEERPTSDIDVLIAEQDVAATQTALRDAGWRDAQVGDDADDFLAGEGYNWKALSPGGVLLELHYRLWGLAQDGLAEAVLARSTPDHAAGATARALTLPDVYVVAAVHLWTHPVPRPLLYWWDLHRIAEAGGPQLAEVVIDEARRWGLQLLVGAAAEAAAGFWDEAANARIAAELIGELRLAERRALARIRSVGVGVARLEPIQLARLLARRPSRMGWLAAWRRVWPHPAVLQAKTPPEWSWLRRRAWFAAWRLGLVRRSG